MGKAIKGQNTNVETAGGGGSLAGANPGWKARGMLFLGVQASGIFSINVEAMGIFLFTGDRLDGC